MSYCVKVFHLVIFSSSHQGMHPRPVPAWAGGGVKNFREVFAGGSEVFILVEGVIWLGSNFVGGVT